jgi:hydroxyethylthiazole kinase-like uncharacterized protein yjeF
VAAPAETVASLQAAEPDVQTLVHAFEGAVSSDLAALIERADAVIVGPGLGRDPGRHDFAVAIIGRAPAVVLDADGLIAFQGRVDTLTALSRGRRLVLTPHPGEFRALFPVQAGGIEVDPWTAAESAAAAVGCTVLLKGVPSVIATSGRASTTVAAGNPGLASGGSGDLLSGIIGALLAQGLDAHAAGGLGAQALGRGADIAARRHTARSMRPVDVVAALPDLWREWELITRSPRAPRPPLLLELAAPERV